MTPSKRAKQLGCLSLRQVSRTSEVAESTLHDWFKNKPKLFDLVCVGVSCKNIDDDIEELACWTGQTTTT